MAGLFDFVILSDPLVAKNPDPPAAEEIAGREGRILQPLRRLQNDRDRLYGLLLGKIE